MKTKRASFAVLCFSVFGLCALASASGAPPVRSLLELRQQNIIMQEWDLSCGAAALTTILRYQFGDNVTEKEVALGLIDRDIYIENPDLVKFRQGFSLLDLKRYVDARGYKGLGFGHMTVDDLVNRAPILVPISVFGYNHFVIFRGRMYNRVLLADPAWGNRTMTVSEFENSWINFRGIGKVGFVVEAEESQTPRQAVNLLTPSASDFVTFN
jgi:predicted double-glycine peptidase